MQNERDRRPRSEGFARSLGEQRGRGSWLATVELEIVVNAESIADLSTRSRQCRSHDGDYDGWKLLPHRSPQPPAQASAHQP
jgi:hypothetical protein